MKTPIESWRRVHRWDWRVRAGFKSAVFIATLVLVLYPRPWIIPRWLGRLADMNAVLTTDHPWVAELAATARATAVPPDELPMVVVAVEELVNHAVPYAYDWDTWGVMDYLPTVDEVFAAGQEDCDGRAVVAAAVLRQLGYEADLVTDLKHTWVTARDPDSSVACELMSPGTGAKTLVGTEQGTRASLASVIDNAGHALAFGITVFPLVRELVLVCVTAALLMHPWSSWGRRVVGAGLLISGLFVIRSTGAFDAPAFASTVLAFGGVALAGSAIVTLAIRVGGRRSPHTLPQ